MDTTSDLTDSFYRSSNGTSMRKAVVLPCSNTINLAKEIVSKSSYLKLGKVRMTYFASGEVCPVIEGNVRGRHVIVVSSGHKFVTDKCEVTVNDIFMELMLLLQATKLADARRIDVIIPLFFYSRQDKKIGSRQPISAKFIADALSMYHVTRVVAIDLHSSQIQGFFSCGMDNLYAIKYLGNAINSYMRSPSNKENKYFLVAPDQGAVKRIEAYSRYLNMDYVQMNKVRSRRVANKIDYITYGGGTLKETELESRHAIIVDDMIDTAGSCIECVKLLTENYGVTSVSLAAVHGIFSGKAFERINAEDKIPAVFCTNTVNQNVSQTLCPKVQVVDISELLAKTCDNLISGKSISKLFPVSE